MALPVIPDTIRAAVRGVASNGEPFANILHFRKTAILSYAGAIAILDPLLHNHYTSAAANHGCWHFAAPASAHLTQFDYTPLDGVTATTVEPHNDAGAAAGDALPASVALVCTLRTAKRGRAYRGRVYVGPWTEASNDGGGVVLAATVTGQGLIWAQFLTDLSGSGVSLVVASYLHSTAEEVTAVTVNGRWDTQRRRLGR